MAKIHGRKGKLFVSTDGGTTRDKLPNVIDWTLTIDAPKTDVSDKDDEGWADYLNELKTWTVDFMLNFQIPTDATQTVIMDAIVNETTLFIALYPNDEGSGQPEWTGNCIIENISPKAPIRGALQVSARACGRGALSIGTQS